jgi:hypothetical protein
LTHGGPSIGISATDDDPLVFSSVPPSARLRSIAIPVLAELRLDDLHPDHFPVALRPFRFSHAGHGVLLVYRYNTVSPSIRQGKSDLFHSPLFRLLPTGQHINRREIGAPGET